MQDGPSADNFAKMLLMREDSVCKLPAKLAQGEGVIGSEERDAQALWICSAARRLGLNLDSSATAIGLLDKVLCSTRVPPKYINCVAATCLHIAKKIWEDYDENIYSYLRRLKLQYSTSEIKRMEIRILVLCDWDLQLPTVSRFLEAILSPLGATYLISPLRTQIEVVMCNWRFVSVFRPSTIALSVVSLLLEGNRRYSWVHSSHHLLKHLDIDITELFRCRETISSIWHPSLLPSFSAYGLLSPEDDLVQPINTINSSSPHCSYSTPSVTPHSSTELTSPQPQPTPC